MRFNSKKGFTLIELLVVITLIGILAIAVLSALNPIEQINKASDARRRADAAQLLKGVDRYFASNQYFPWNSTQLTDDYLASVDAEFKQEASVVGTGVCGGTDYDAEGAGASGCTTDGLLVDTQELKAQFGKRNYFKTTKVASDILYVIKEAAEPSVSVCFIPMSKATRDDTSKLKIVSLTALGTGISACSAVPGSADWSDLDNACLVCIPEE